MKLLLDDGNEHVGRHGAPDLRLDCVLAGAQKTLDAQVLLDPFEEQLHLPSVLVQGGNSQCRQACVVGQKYQRLARFWVFEPNTAQVFGIVLGDVEAVECNALIADHAGISIGRRRIHAPRIHTPLGAGDKEGSGLMHLVQPSKIQIAPIHHIEGTRLDRQDVQYIDLVHLAVADVNESGDRAAQIQQRMHLHRRFGCAKRCPIEQAQTQVDSGCVQRVDGSIQVDVQRVFGIETSGTLNQSHGQCVIDAPISQIQRIGQRRACRHTLHPHVKQLGLIGGKADLDVAQGFSPSQLRKDHYAKQIGATQSANTGIAAMAVDDPTKRLPWHVLHDLCKQCLAHVHASPQAVQTREHRKCAN